MPIRGVLHYICPPGPEPGVLEFTGDHPPLQAEASVECYEKHIQEPVKNQLTEVFRG
jgi:hypothetical protein